MTSAESRASSLVEPYIASQTFHWTDAPNAYEAQRETVVQGVRALPESDRRLVVEYVERRAALGNLTEKSVQIYYASLKAFLNILHARERSLSTMSDDDALDLVRALGTMKTARGEPLSEYTRSDYWRIFKGFVAYAHKRRGGLDPLALDTVQRYVYKRNRSNVRKKSIFTPDEINRLLDLEKEYTWRVFLEFVFCAGPRISEVRGVRVCDVQMHEHGEVSVHFPRGKTGPRTVYVVGACAHTIARWLALHPFRDDPAAPFFLNSALRPVGYKGAEKRLKDLVKRAGLQKDRVCLQGARASAATNDAAFMPDSVLCKKFGWVQGSPMPRHYIRTSGLDLREAEHRAHQMRFN